MFQQTNSLTVSGIVTASGKTQLRSMTVARLRNYLEAYGIQPKSMMLEKGDLVEAILDARVNA